MIHEAMPRGGRREGAGRPPRIDGKPSEEIYPIRCTHAERAAWERSAKVNDKPLSDWVRDTLNAAAVKH